MRITYAVSLADLVIIREFQMQTDLARFDKTLMQVVASEGLHSLLESKEITYKPEKCLPLTHSLALRGSRQNFHVCPENF